MQAFKKGPDYIDPMWLAAATGRACHNLDYQTMTEAEILATFARHGHGADLSIIEGNKGLYDGLDLEGGAIPTPPWRRSCGPRWCWSSTPRA